MHSQPTEYTPESVLESIAGHEPVKFQSLLPSPRSSKKRQLGPVVRLLLEQGLIRRVRIDGEMFLATAKWSPSPDLVRLQIDGRSRATHDGCVEWLDKTDPVGGPRFWLVHGDGTTRHVSVRRWLWNAAGLRGRCGSPNLREQDIISMKCGNEACILVEHMYLRDRSDALRGRTRPLTTRIRMSEHHSNRKLSEQAVEEIRSSTDPGKVLAQRYGVTEAAISAVRLYKVQRPLRGLFTQLINP